MVVLMSILSNFLLIPTSTDGFSSLKSISGGTQTHFLTSHLHLTTLTLRFDTMKIRMGGGPRTYPGGVSKWQWKRMQANKSKQLLKARLARERQIYEMRKRAELKAAVTELERPWEVVEKAPNLFSIGADEQLKVLADRFQKPGGFDMWSERDGPELFKSCDDGVPSARFFPKGVVHSIKPYGKIENSDNRETDLNTDVEDSEEQGDRITPEDLGDVSANRSNRITLGEIRQKKIADNVNKSLVTPNRSRQKNHRNKYSGNSAELGEGIEQNFQTRYSGSTSNTVNGNDLGSMRNRSKQVNYKSKFSRNSIEGEESGDQTHQMRYSGCTSEVRYHSGNRKNDNDLGVMRNRSSRQNNNHNDRNRYSSNSAKGGDSKDQNHQLRYSGNRMGSNAARNRIGMRKDMDVYDMSVQKDGSYEFQAKD